MGQSSSDGLLERETELGEVGRLLDRASADSGTLLVVEGEPGIGKTALLRAVRAASTAAGFTTLASRGGELERDFPFGVVRQMFDRIVLSDGADNGGGHLLDGPASLARPLFAAGDGETSNGDVSQAILQGLFWLVVNLSEPAPLALVIDDAHWSDPASLRFVDYLARRVDQLPVLLVVAIRPPQSEEQRELVKHLRAAPILAWLPLAALSTAATRAVLERELGVEPQAEFANASQSLTGGNPFLIEELAFELARLGIEGRDGNVSRLAGISPDSIKTAILGRLETLGEAPKAVAEAVAILGDGTPLRQIAALVGADVDAAGTSADALAGAHVLTPTRPPGFRHPLLRTAVLDSISPARRSRLHAAAAHVLQAARANPSRIATHLLATEPGTDRAVVGALVDAAHESLAKGSPESAAVFLTRALDETSGEDPERAALLVELGGALSATDPPKAAAVLVEALSCAGTPQLKCRATGAAAHAMCTVGRVRDARDLVEDQLDRIEYAGEPAVRELARMATELQFTAADRPEGAMAAAQRYWKWAADDVDETAIAAAQQAYVLCASGSDPGLAHRLAREAASESRVLRLLGPDEYSFAAVIVALEATGQLAAAAEQATAGLELARRTGNLTAVVNCSMWRSLVGALAGDLIGAESDARTALSIADEIGQQIGVPIATASLASVLLERNEIAQASAMLEDPELELDRLLDDNRQAVSALIARGATRFLTGRIAEAAADLDRVAEIATGLGDRNPAFSEWRATRVLTLAAASRTAEAEAQAEENLTLAQRWGTPRSVGLALRTCAAIESDPALRLQRLRDAARALEESEARLEHAKANVFLGAELRRQSKRVEARDVLREGLDGALRCSADGLAEFARSELTAAGGKPRRERISGPESLTASERRVADMAAAGRTNREIAEALFVTVKAVTYHLTNCYRKLDIGGRDQLAEALSAE